MPDDLDGFLKLCQGLQKIGHPCGFSLGHALGDANGYASWLLWTHGAYLVDDKGKIAIDSKETIAAMKYATELQKTMIQGTLSWNDSGNNKAYQSGQIGLTFNGVSIYYTCKSSPDPAVQAIAADTQHKLQPRGVSKTNVQSATPLNAMVFKHTKYPNAAKDYIRFMMEKEQYGPWLSNCIGYWSEPLKAYSKMKFWTTIRSSRPMPARWIRNTMTATRDRSHRPPVLSPRTIPSLTCSPRSPPAMPRRRQRPRWLQNKQSGITKAEVDGCAPPVEAGLPAASDLFEDA